jgi:hypothetical protein
MNAKGRRVLRTRLLYLVVAGVLLGAPGYSVGLPGARPTADAALIETGVVEITGISGGFGITIDVINHGPDDAASLTWSMDVSGGVWFGNHAEGPLPTIPPGSGASIKSGFFFGMGPVELMVRAGGSIRHAQAVLLGPFCLGCIMQTGRTAAIPDEGCFPDPHRAYDYPFESLSGWENRTVTVEEWGWVEPEPDLIKSALIDHGPLTVCIHVYKDFMHYSGGVYRHRWGQRVGGHLVSLLGYDDGEQCWTCKNSWGADWGDDGWFKMAYDADMFIPRCYGGTGVLYVDGVSGVFEPDVPRLWVVGPTRYNLYLFGRELPALLDRAVLQNGTPKIIGRTDVEIAAENTRSVAFYLDGHLVATDVEPPFSWRIDAPSGYHTIDAYATNGRNQSRAVIDIQVIV